MAINTTSARQHLRNFDFPELFIEVLGWDRLQISPVTIDVEGETYQLHPVAEKRGVQIFRCDPDANGRVPPYPIRQKIDRAIAKIAYEHLIIYVDATRSIQVWQ